MATFLHGLASPLSSSPNIFCLQSPLQKAILNKNKRTSDPPNPQPCPPSKSNLNKMRSKKQNNMNVTNNYKRRRHHLLWPNRTIPCHLQPRKPVHYDLPTAFKPFQQRPATLLNCWEMQLWKCWNNWNLPVIHQKSIFLTMKLLNSWNKPCWNITLNTNWSHHTFRAIQTYKTHFIASLCSADPAFSAKEWDRFMPQIELTLNLLRNCRYNPKISARTALHSAFDFNKSPLATLETHLVIHEKTDNHATS